MRQQEKSERNILALIIEVIGWLRMATPELDKKE